MTSQSPEASPIPDALDPDEFLAQYTAVEALIEEADEAEDTNLLDIVSEKQFSLERENPRAAQRLKRERLGNLDRKERQQRLKAAETIIRARKSRK